MSGNATVKNKQTIVVNLIAGAGAGKSTTAAKVFALLKDHDVDCELVREVYKDAIWSENKTLLEDEFLVLAEQNHLLRKVVGKVDVVISDAPLFLKLLYTPDEEYIPSEVFKPLVRSLSNQFWNVNYQLLRTKKYNPNGRLQTESEAIENDARLRQLLEENDIPFRRVTGNTKGAEAIVRAIIEMLEAIALEQQLLDPK